MRPGFFTLFKRGFYSRPARRIGSQKTGLRGAIDESERFAAAAIAFTWQHEPKFREHFWNRICCFEGDATLTDKAEIFVEPYRWADLLIRNPDAQRDVCLRPGTQNLTLALENIQNPAKASSSVWRTDTGGSSLQISVSAEKYFDSFYLGAEPRCLRTRPWTLT